MMLEGSGKHRGSASEEWRQAKPEGLPYDESLGADDDWHADPERSAAKHELADEVHCALGKLSPLHRDVIILHELHGYGEYRERVRYRLIPGVW